MRGILATQQLCDTEDVMVFEERLLSVKKIDFNWFPIDSEPFSGFYLRGHLKPHRRGLKTYFSCFSTTVISLYLPALEFSAASILY